MNDIKIPQKFSWLRPQVIEYFVKMAEKQKRKMPFVDKDERDFIIYKNLKEVEDPHRLKEISHRRFKDLWELRMHAVESHVKRIYTQKEEMWDFQDERLPPTPPHLALIMIGYSLDSQGIGDFLREHHDFRLTRTNMRISNWDFPFNVRVSKREGKRLVFSPQKRRR